MAKPPPCKYLEPPRNVCAFRGGFLWLSSKRKTQKKENETLWFRSPLRHRNKREEIIPNTCSHKGLHDR